MNASDHRGYRAEGGRIKVDGFPRGIRIAPREGGDAARVEAAIERLGYVYNRGAANLRRARSNIVGMVINDLMNPFFAELAVGIERALGLRSHSVHRQHG